MGIFNFLKSNKSSSENSNTNNKTRIGTKEETKGILSELGVNPYDYKHEEMEPSEISLNEEPTGAIKVSDITYELEEKEFNYISLTDNENGTKSLYLSQNQPKERAIKVLVDKYFEVFGEAKYAGKEFVKYDVVMMNEKPYFELREWNLPGFKLIIGYNKDPEMYSNYLLVEEN